MHLHSCITHSRWKHTWSESMLRSSSLQSTRNEIRVKDIEDRSESSSSSLHCNRSCFFFHFLRHNYSSQLSLPLTRKHMKHALNNNHPWGAKNIMLFLSRRQQEQNKRKCGDDYVLVPSSFLVEFSLEFNLLWFSLLFFSLQSHLLSSIPYSIPCVWANCWASQDHLLNTKSLLSLFLLLFLLSLNPSSILKDRRKRGRTSCVIDQSFNPWVPFKNWRKTRIRSFWVYLSPSLLYSSSHSFSRESSFCSSHSRILCLFLPFLLPCFLVRKQSCFLFLSFLSCFTQELSSQGKPWGTTNREMRNTDKTKRHCKQIAWTRDLPCEFLSLWRNM